MGTEYNEWFCQTLYNILGIYDRSYIKYSQHREIFQMKMVDADVIYTRISCNMQLLFDEIFFSRKQTNLDIGFM
jgi:hypothetical protein